eukprot:m.53616 g.53616  ORF g.53616 m.53616 type:complete len:226 (-) comp13182_c1_seq1:437-1114(-)
MKLTAELIVNSPQFTNTLGDREIDMRGNKIPAIENLGATLDQFDTIDFSDNEIRRLDGFPPLKRLKTLLLNNNRIARIAEHLEVSLPNLEEIVLTGNQFAELSELEPLAALPKLTRLSLLNNPVTSARNYRLFLIHCLPNLHLLDFAPIKDQERKDAKKLFEGKQGEKLKAEILKKTAAAAQEKAAAARPAPSKETEAIKNAIRNATSLEEVRRLEQQLRAGGGV